MARESAFYFKCHVGHCQVFCSRLSCGGWIARGTRGSEAVGEAAAVVVQRKDGAMEYNDDGFGDGRNDGLDKWPGCGG